MSEIFDRYAYMRGAVADLPRSDQDILVLMAVLKTLHNRLDDDRRRDKPPPRRDLTGLVLAAMTADAAARKGERDIAEAQLTEVAANAIHALIEMRRGRT